MNEKTFYKYFIVCVYISAFILLVYSLYKQSTFGIFVSIGIGFIILGYVHSESFRKALNKFF